MEQSTVYIVDDDTDVRDSLSWLIESAGFKTQNFASAEEFLEFHTDACCGCLILDLQMPGMNGSELFERLRSGGSLLPVIFLTAHADVSTAVRLVKLGAFDFVEKPFAEGEIVSKVQQAVGHHQTLMDRKAELAEARSRLLRLTAREQEVFELVARGQANKVIALDLGISERTVEIHRAAVMRKMEAKTLADLIRMATMLEPAPDQGNPL